MITKRAYPLFNPSFYPADKLESNDGLKKEASLSSDTTQFVDKIASNDPVAKKKIFIVNGLGASDYYGKNRNGDAFFEKHLTSKQTPAEAKKNKGELKGKCLPRYKTFVNGHAFEHHKNDDPENAIGDLLTSFWNDQMKRVEVIAKLNENKAEEVIKDYHDGKPIAWSMGCFLPDQEVELYNRKRVEIQDINEGDSVVTHSADTGEVTEVHTRQYDDTIYSIKTATNEPVKATKEHPWLVMDREDVKDSYADGSYYRFKDKDDIDLDNAEWKCSSHLQEWDYLVKPVNQEVLTPDYADKNLARFLGYYLAEGHVVINKKGEPSGISFCTHEDDVIHNEIEDMIEEMDTEYEPTIRSDRKNTPTLTIELYDTELAKLCWEHCGRYSKDKALSESIQRWDHELQKEFLGAYISGDGWQNNNGTSKEGVVMISTGSENLANQIQHMLFRNGMHCNIQTNIHEAGKGFSSSPTTEYVLRISKAHTNKIAPYSGDIEKTDTEGSPGGKRMLTENAMLTPVTDIEELEYNGTVYNLEVDHEDSSYLVDNLAVHNCKVDSDRCSKCGNRASSRKDYCKHLKENMGDVLPSGEAIYAINDRPRFFDLSIVTIPADETAYTLKVVGMDEDVEPEDGTDLKPDDRFVSTLKDSLQKTSSDKSAESEKQSDIVKEIIGVDAENMDITKVIEKFLNDQIDKEQLIKILTHEFVGEKTARVMHEADTSVDFPIDISDLEKSSASFEGIMKVSDERAARQMHRALSEAGAIQKGDPKMQDLSKIREEDANYRQGTGMAIAGGNIVADVLQTLKNGSDEEIKGYLKGRPGLVNFLLRLLAGSATGVASAVISELTSTGTPEPVVGQISGKQN